MHFWFDFKNIMFQHFKIVSTIISTNLLLFSDLNAREFKTYAQIGSGTKYVKTSKEKWGGLCPRIFDLLNKQNKNIKVSLNPKAVNLKRILGDMESGEIDLFCGIFKNQERLKRFHYGPVVYHISYAIAVRESNDIDFLNTKNLGGIKIGFLRGGAAKEKFEKKFDDFEAFQVTSAVNSLLMVISSRLDGAVYTDFGLYSLLKEHSISGIKIVPFIQPPKPQFIVFSKQVDKKTIDQFDYEFQKLRKTSEYQKLAKEYQVLP